MNLIYVGDCGPKPSGAPISSDQLIRALAGRGHRVRALTPELDGGDPELGPFDAARPEVEALHYPVPFYFIDPFERPPADWHAMTRAGVRDGLERMIAASRPDALLLRELWLPYAMETALHHGIPTVALVRGNPTSAILAGVFPDDLRESFLAELGHANRIVCVARHLEQGLERLGFARASCIENAVDAKRFAPGARDHALAARLEIADRDVVALHAAQIKPIKRPLDIVRSAALALRHVPEMLHLIIGEGKSRDEMIALAIELGVAHRFRFVPFVDNDRMPSYLGLADLVLMPSEREGMSRVYLEALACGRVLIASDIAGAREVVVHEETGLLHRKGDVPDMAAQIVRAARDPALRDALGWRGRQRVLERHDIERAVDRYERVLAELC
jgi:glycosyltransferase involved in cell wall biosynthesis